jgi:hypothetical protein
MRPRHDMLMTATARRAIEYKFLIWLGSFKRGPGCIFSETWSCGLA